MKFPGIFIAVLLATPSCERIADDVEKVEKFDTYLRNVDNLNAFDIKLSRIKLPSHLAASPDNVLWTVRSQSRSDIEISAEPEDFTIRRIGDHIGLSLFLSPDGKYEIEISGTTIRFNAIINSTTGSELSISELLGVRRLHDENQ